MYSASLQQKVYHYYYLQHEQISLKVFEKIMTHHSVLIQFAYVYKLGFNEFLLIKDMIHPNRDRKLDEPSPLSV